MNHPRLLLALMLVSLAAPATALPPSGEPLAPPTALERATSSNGPAVSDNAPMLATRDYDAFGFMPQKTTPTPSARPNAALPPALDLDGDCNTGPLHDTHPYDQGALTLPVDCTGRLGELDAWDFYNLTIPASTTLVVQLDAPSDMAIEVCLTPPDDWFSGEAECALSHEGHPARLYMDFQEETTWGIFLWYYEGEGEYRLRAHLSAWTLTPDCESGTDAGNATTPLPTGVPSACTGSLHPRLDAQDWYSVHLEPGVAATVSLTPNQEADFDLCAYKATDLAHPVDCSERYVGITDRVLLAPPNGGDYLIRVLHYLGGGTYDLAFSPAALQDDCGLSMDAGSRWRLANATFPGTCAGTLSPAEGDLWDAYRFNPTTGGIRVTLAPHEAPLTLCLYPPTSDWPIQCGQQEGASLVTEVVYMTAWPGRWFVSVIGQDEPSSYELTITGFTPTAQHDCESGLDAGDGHSEALPVSMPGTCAGALVREEGDWRDEYRFSLPEARLNLTVVAQSVVYVCVGSPIAWGECEEVPAGTVYSFERETLEASSWSIRFWGEDAYTFTVRLEAPYSDCATGGDAGSNFQKAALLPSPQARCVGILHGYGDMVDWYKFPVQPGQNVIIHVESGVGRLEEACLVGPNGETIDCARGVVDPMDPDMVFVLNGLNLTGGEYRLGLRTLRWFDAVEYHVTFATL